MKRAMFCLLLLSACSGPDDPPVASEYALMWFCRSPGGCERTEEVKRIDRMERARREFLFTSTQDETFTANAMQIFSDSLPPRCSWLYYLTLFDHELERSRLCFGPGGFELELAIPNQDPTTYSMWLVEGRDVNLF